MTAFSPFRLTRPAVVDTAMVFASPHSGRALPPGFLDRAALDERLIRSSEDAFVDRLFAAAPRHGAPLLAASAARAVIDLNRAPDELDPAAVEGVRRSAHNPRVASGLGVIPRVVAGGRPIRQGRIPLSEAQARIDGIWRPYHAQLQALLAEAQLRFGRAILIDCHSMPREALTDPDRPDVVLGDRFGAAAAPEVVAAIERAFVAEGFRVARNVPFAGAYSVQHYGRPSRRQHAVQIEIDRALYMDEARVEAHEGFVPLSRRLTRVVAALAEIGRPSLSRLAAE